MSTTISYFQKFIPTSLGTLHAFADEEALHRLIFIDNSELPSLATGETSHPVLDLLTQELHAYFAGTLQDFTIPLKMQGTSFQLRVWECLKAMPYGRKSSYQQIACTLGMTQASRAVGNAIGANPIALLVPCHRIIRTNGTTGEYRYGTDRKRWLLHHEAGHIRLEV